MATGKDQGSLGAPRGFAGLSSIVSKVDLDVPGVARPADRVNRDASQGSASALQPASQIGASDRLALASNEEPRADTVAGRPHRSSGRVWWVVAAAIVVGLIAVGLVTPEKPGYTPPPAYTPNQSAATTTPSAPAVAQPPAASVSLSPAAPATSQAEPISPQEERPPVGGDERVLTAKQIRYCVSEGIRLEASRAILDRYRGDAVDLFNALIDDYNSRCSEYSYRHGVLESVQAEVEQSRARLEAEGRNRFTRLSVQPTPSPSVLQLTPRPSAVQETPSPGKAQPTFDPFIKATQERLRELGFDPGSADGISGPKTQFAIRTFQRVHGLPVDGVASNSLLERLDAAVAATRATSSQPPSPVPQSYGSGDDHENLQRCLTGQYKALCDHRQLTPDQAKQVDAAEKRVNFETCISGQYKALCDHRQLTPDQAKQVDAAEKRVNFETCITGQYKALCDHSQLTHAQKSQVADAERRVNYQTCISGRYKILCDHSLLTPEEAAKVTVAEKNAGN